MYWIYNILLLIYWIGLIPVLLYGMVVKEGFYERLKPSMGFMTPALQERIAGRPVIWVHGASVGEIVAASPIVKDIQREFPQVAVVVSVVTKVGYGMAERILPDAEGIIFFPLDRPFFVRRALHLFNPLAILLVETELWPNFLRIAKKEQIPVMMVNGRISGRSHKRYMRIQSFVKGMLGSIDRFCMQSNIAAEYITDLGAHPSQVTVTGNTKYDQTYATVTEAEKEELLSQFGFSGHFPIIVVGSTHKGEEEIILEAFNGLREQYPKARLLLAPRQIIRAEEIVTMCESYGLQAVRRSTMDRPTDEATPVVILDTIGELGRLYALGDIIFVGGSFVPVGGHNILEPAAHGKPIVVGPHMFNFTEIYQLLSDRGACRMVHSAEELQAEWTLLSEQEEVRTERGAHCLEVVVENQGATHRNVQELRRLLEAYNRLP